MSQFDIKMTALADSIKSKNTSVAGKLSIDDMITAVQGIQVGADLPEGVTATPADVKDGVYYIDGTGAKREGEMTNHGTVNVTLTESEQTLTSGYYDEIVIPAQSSSSGDSAITYGVMTTEGNFKALDLAADTPTDIGEAEPFENLMMYMTGHPEPQYAGGGNMAFYRCASYDNGEAIPSYNNLIISGITAPEAVNGTYVITDVTAEGTSRAWSNGTYTVTNSNMTWYIVPDGAALNETAALYYCEVLPSTTGVGTADNPVYWDDALNDGADRYITEVYSTGDYTSSGNKRNFYVKLKAGTAYQMGVTDNGNDNVVRLYDLTGKSLAENDGNSIEINGASCSDAFTYTPTADGIYRFEAGAWSTAVGDVQAVCFPAPEVSEAPTQTEPWEIEWTVGGADEGAYIITDAGYAPAIGTYTPSTETYNQNTIWTNVDTGAVWKAYVSGSKWSWQLYANESSSGPIYYEGSYRNYATPWEVDDWYNSSTYAPLPTFSKGTGKATGTLTIAKVNVAERPATGVQVWTGYKATQDTETLKWNFENIVTEGLLVKGMPPVVGRIYSADTTIQVAQIIEDVPGQMVCLAHFDNFSNDTAPTFTDSTGTCLVQIMQQSSIVTTDTAKFGNGRWGGNYRNPPTGGCFNIVGLPEITGDFTVEMWFYYTAYDEFGGTFVYTYTGDSYDPQNVVEIRGVELAPTNPLYKEKEWIHRAFVRQGTTVTEYINGVKVATSEFTVPLGGDRKVSICGGGTNVGDVRNYIDEFAIFNYAKYDKNFTPPMVPYEDIPSGLHEKDTTVGEVSVSGITSVTFANSKSYSLIDSTATGTSRKWKNATGDWFIVYDANWVMGWCVTNSDNEYDDSRIIAAVLVDDGMMWEPIGNSKWQDYYTKAKVKVTAN